MAQSSGEPPFELSVDGLAGSFFHVHSFTGEETISESYSFDIVVTADVPSDVIEQAILGRRAVLVLHVGENPRAFHGVVSAVRLAEAHHAAGAIQYHVRLVPRLWLLKRKKRTRIFQHMRVTDVVTAVLQEAGIATRWQLVRAYPVREYCTQYEETDYRFIKRLLAEAGIYFYFTTGPAADAAALAASAVMGAATAAGTEVLGDVAGPMGTAVGSMVGAAAQAAGPLIPGDTVVCADDALSYPPLAGDDAAALAASTAAALAPAVGDALGVDGVAGAVLGGASAVAGAAIALAAGALGDAPVLRFRGLEGSNVGTLDTITRFVLRNTVRSSAAYFRDYDPARPLVRAESWGVSTDPFPPSPFEAISEVTSAVSTVADAVGVPDVATDVLGEADAAVNTVAGALGQKVPFEVYEHHSPFLFPKWSFLGDEASRILRQKRRRASIAEGLGNHPELSPGHRFTLSAHPASQLDRQWVATRVKHRGQTRPQAGRDWKVYEHDFECAPAEMTYVPPRPKRKSVQVSLTATVVGPPGQEIYVDPLGQIKVQFHWDRDGKFDDKSSCWIRTMQPWGGAAWGHQFIPRVGMEVVVTFEGGDPDKPMVLGSLYNGTHPPPFALPLAKTKSGIRTQSSPGGRGYNELSFDDQAGGEMIHLHAQHDYDEVIRHEQRSHVMGARAVRVDGPKRELVGKDSALEVHGERATAVGKDDKLRVGGNQSTEVAGDRWTDIDGGSTTTVKQACSVEVRGHRSLVVGTAEEGSRSDHYVFGGASLGASETIFLNADKGVTLRCGESEIEITKEKIVLRADTIELSPKKALECGKKDGPSVTMGDDGVEILTKKFKMFTESGALEVDKEFKAKGDKIKLGYSPSEPSKDKQEKEPEKKPFKLKLTDYMLQPYASKKYHLMVEGLRLEGDTDGDGMVQQDIPKAAKQVVVRLWIDKYPEGRQQVYTVNLAKLPPASDVVGAKQRLKNLGYYHGVMDTEKGEDFRHAVAEFQQDHHDSHGLEPTGELDDGTIGALEEVHGS